MGHWAAKLVPFVLNQPPHVLANDGTRWLQRPLASAGVDPEAFND